MPLPAIAFDPSEIIEVPCHFWAFACKRCRVAGHGDEPHSATLCACGVKVPTCALIDKQGRGKVCPHCAHAHELSIFTPPDHDADTCQLCKTNK